MAYHQDLLVCLVPNVGGYLPRIEQGNGTSGYCRYTQAIPMGLGGRLDVDSNYGFRKSFLPQGNREYSPLRQPTAQQVIHSGIPVILVPLDATNTIPITEKFFETFEKNQHTYEAQYCFKSLKIGRDTWFDDQFYTSYFMWDSFMSGIAASIMRKQDNHQGENEFAEMELINITVATSNMPYGISDGSNPFFDVRRTPRFDLERNGVHSGHVQTRLRDPFCIVKNGRGRCQDGYTKEVTGPGGVPVLVAVRAKPNQNTSSLLDGELFATFLDVLNQRENAGIFNFSSHDFLITEKNSTNQISGATGDCKYNKAIPQGSGGFLDSDTLYGLSRSLPRSPRRYTAENSVKFGAPRDSDHPELRQPLALEVWESVVKSLDPGSKDIIVVGGHINLDNSEKGNVINVPSNRFAELNKFLDPLAAKTVLSSELNITVIPLGIQRKEIFLGEILGAVVLAGDYSVLKPIFDVKDIKVTVSGYESEDGQITLDDKQGKSVKVLENLDP
ncbi:hypothetical protein K7X08_008497 [Anisodus acutangulus]|uniref:Inosine/uridine-preferring nucleoside hydrolase domain-containing protein n=1 Tax=Anisodus acutangulus TaxID=402998 RepID=A0A9Q1MUL9_9SOLA|nr:hypothetical protein K7X08_008497 [Anisodus acutangulus]